MLTVKEINEVSFGKAGFSGYKPEDVDNFIDQVAASFQELLGQRDTAVKQTEELAALNSELAAKNADCQRKLSVLAQKVEAYRADEDGIKEVVLSAHHMSKALMKEAEQKAADIVREARAQADAKLLEANEEARRIRQSAENDVAKSAKEYARLADTKKTELEEIKKQVTAFRSSLLEMYKKHLECIEHIPTFKQKDEPDEVKPLAVSEPVKIPEPALEPPVKTDEPEFFSEPEPQEPVYSAEPEPEIEPQPQAEAAPEPVQPIQEYREPHTPRHAQQPPRAAREKPPVQQPQSPQPVQRPAARPSTPSRLQEQPQARTLNDTYNYVQEQLQPSRLPESYLEDNDLTSIGIDLNAHTDIPEALRREKNNNYSNLPFGDGVEVDGRKRRR